MSDLRARPRAKDLPGIARHGRLKRSSPFKTLTKILAAVVGVLLVSTASIAAIAAWNVGGSMKPAVTLVDSKGKPVVPDIGPINGGFNVLLVGSDSGGGNAAYGERGETLNDVTMLLHVSADHQNATVVSFPRDLFVAIPSCPDPEGGSFSAMSRQKINNSLAYGGLACTVLTVQKLTGLEIPYAALIEFDGVVAMSNAVGGVPVCVAGDIDDDLVNPPLHLKAGEYTLQGGEALSYLRTRHGIGDGSDLGRISNQQSFMSSLVRTIKSAGTLGNPAKVYGIAKAAASNMQLSESLSSITTMASMAAALKDIQLDKVVFVQYPNHYVSGGGGVEPTRDAADQLMHALSNDQAIALTGSVGGGTVLDPAAQVPAATDAADQPAPDASSAPGAPAVELPQSVTGQTAAQQTCAKPFSE